MAERLSNDAVTQRLNGLHGWSRDGETIHKQFGFADFLGSIAFVNAVAQLAEAANHHPDMTINYNRVSLVLSTHDAGGLTQNDFDLAQEFEALPAAQA